MRRRPRLNSDIKLRAIFLRCTATAFFRRGLCFRWRPTFPWRPPSRAPAREPGLDAPAQAVVAGAPWRRTIRQGDDPWLRMAFRMHHGNMRAGAFPGQRDVLQPVFAVRETLGQGRLATVVVEHAQVLLAAQPPAPAVIATPGDQR